MLQEKVDALHDLLQGDWGLNEIVHYCCGHSCRCSGRREKAEAAVIELMLWLIFYNMPVTPSFSRWTTLGPCLAWFGMANLVHGVLRRACLLAFASEKETEGANDPDDAGLEDYAKQLGRSAGLPSPPTSFESNPKSLGRSQSE